MRSCKDDRPLLDAETPDGRASLGGQPPSFRLRSAAGTCPCSAASSAGRRGPPARPPVPLRCSSRDRRDLRRSAAGDTRSYRSEPLALVVGAVGAAPPRPFVPVDPQPLQVVEEIRPRRPWSSGLGPYPRSAGQRRRRNGGQTASSRGPCAHCRHAVPPSARGQNGPGSGGGHGASPLRRVTTAKAAAPSPAPTSPIPSFVLALTLTRAAGIPRMPAMFAAISPR